MPETVLINSFDKKDNIYKGLLYLLHFFISNHAVINIYFYLLLLHKTSVETKGQKISESV